MDIEFNTNPPHKYWGWVFLIGIFLLIVGGIAVAAPFITTITSMFIFGWLMIFAGASQLVFAFTYRHSDNFFIYTLTSILTILIGALIVANPAATAAAMTLLLAVFFLGAGIFRIYTALALRFQHWGWMLFGGILSFILGVLILMHWPTSALWIIGLFIGIELLFTGWSFILSAFVLKNTK